MNDAPWTLDRIEATRPDLAPLARLHRALADAARRVAAERAEALHPTFTGAPAVHWMAGRPLFDASNRAALAPAVAALFDALARAAADAFPETRAAVDELHAATSRPGFSWPIRIVKFRDAPSEPDIPHPALFRFLMLRAAAVPAAHLAHAFSPPHAERWLPASCPYCGVPAAAAVAGQGSGRTLLCVLCGGRWTRDGLECVACGEERRETQLVLADRELGPASLEACGTCRHAIKLFAAGDVPDAAPVALEVLTVHLDVLAKSDDLSRDAVALAALFPPA
jgi:formate dehydrogenase maturation protein FdhE